jgi:hypothetical protein
MERTRTNFDNALQRTRWRIRNQNSLRADKA